MKENLERPWLCVTCGYAMNAATSPTHPGAKPKDGDVAMCLNCTAAYLRREEAWHALSREAERTLPTYLVENILRARVHHQMAGFPDLSKRGPRA